MDASKEQKFRSAISRINNANHIALITHKKPDGDALGSICGLKTVFDRIKKNNQMFCIDAVPNYLKFLPHHEQVSPNFEPNSFDLIVTLDCGADYMTGYQQQFPDLFQKRQNLINIDHHPSNNNFGEINIIDTYAASTSIIIYEILEFAKFPIDADIATCLLTGIYTDTGSFMHSNTNSQVYAAAAKLLNRGARISLIVKNAFKTTPVNTLRLWGRVLNSLKINDEGITMAVATAKDFQETNTKPDELSGIVDLLNTVPDVKFSLLLNEDEKGNVKGSFRTQKDDINLSEIAGVFGGGGHKKAAGFTIPGKLQKEIRWKIVPEADKI